MIDMSSTIVPKSDQLNADDLIGGPRTITVTRVTGNEGNAEQPVNVFYEGDGGKPFRPCKSMRRVMVKIWGADASKYVGQSMTIFRDPKVKWGGMEVGGIRISHMTGIDAPQTMALTETRAKRTPYTVQPLKMEAKADKAADGARELLARIEAADDVGPILADATVTTQRAWLAKNRPELAVKIDRAIAAKQPADDDPFAEPAASEPAAEEPAPKPDADLFDRLCAKIDECTATDALDEVANEFDAFKDDLTGKQCTTISERIETMRRALAKREHA